MNDYTSMTNEELANRLVNRVEFDVIHEADDYSQGVKDIRAEFARRDAESARLRTENEALKERLKPAAFHDVEQYYRDDVEIVENEPDPRDAELSRLRTENAELRQRCEVLEEQAWPGTRGL